MSLGSSLICAAQNKSGMPLVSVIVPFYNPGKELLRTIESILCQSHRNIEIICVNDGCTDDSNDIFRDITDGQE